MPPPVTPKTAITRKRPENNYMKMWAEVPEHNIRTVIKPYMEYLYKNPQSRADASGEFTAPPGHDDVVKHLHSAWNSAGLDNVDNSMPHILRHIDAGIADIRLKLGALETRRNYLSGLKVSVAEAALYKQEIIDKYGELLNKNDECCGGTLLAMIEPMPEFAREPNGLKSKNGSHR